MPIRPIDMISIAPRSQEASHQQTSDQNRLNHAHQNMADQFSKHVKDEAEVVIQTSKGEQQEYRYDAKEKGNGTYRGNSGKKDKKQKKEEQKEHKGENKVGATPKSSFDIKI